MVLIWKKCKSLPVQPIVVPDLIFILLNAGVKVPIFFPLYHLNIIFGNRWSNIHNEAFQMSHDNHIQSQKNSENNQSRFLHKNESAFQNTKVNLP